MYYRQKEKEKRVQLHRLLSYKTLKVSTNVKFLKQLIRYTINVQENQMVISGVRY